MNRSVRLFCTTVLLAAGLGSVAAAAHAACVTPCSPSGAYCNTQGGRIRNQGGSDNGTRAYIAGSGHTNSSGEVVAYVAAVQNTASSEPGGVQIGELSQSSDFSTVCGAGVTVAFFEYVISNQTTYHCPYHSGISQFGNGGLFDVVYQNGAWQGNQNGNNVGTAPALGFTAGWSIVSDEAWLQKGNTGPAEAITYGPSGHNAWQFTTNNGSTYSNIQTSLCNTNNDSDSDSDGDWNLGGTPSPFNINWTGF